jgi:hypothetical protein
VHEGVPRIGGKSVSEEDAFRLLAHVNEIIALLRQWLPVDLRWPEFELKTQMTFQKKIL